MLSNATTLRYYWSERSQFFLSNKFQPDSTCRTHSRHNRTFGNSKRSGSAATTAQCEVRSGTRNIFFIYFILYSHFFFWLGLLWVSTKRFSLEMVWQKSPLILSRLHRRPSSNAVPNETSALTIQCKLADRKINSNLRNFKQQMCEYGGTASPIKKRWCPQRNKWMNIDNNLFALKKFRTTPREQPKIAVFTQKFISGLVVFALDILRGSTCRYEPIFGSVPQSHSNATECVTTERDKRWYFGNAKNEVLVESSTCAGITHHRQSKIAILLALHFCSGLNASFSFPCYTFSLRENAFCRKCADR